MIERLCCLVTDDIFLIGPIGHRNQVDQWAAEPGKKVDDTALHVLATLESRIRKSSVISDFRMHVAARLYPSICSRILDVKGGVCLRTLRHLRDYEWHEP
jgi:hypothetical protein